MEHNAGIIPQISPYGLLRMCRLNVQLQLNAATTKNLVVLVHLAVYHLPLSRRIGFRVLY